ncbi:MAG TPA: chemotaxis protein CheA [Acetobacteraceae bacterium]|nr:chemotaxis protein CheA [Acetobacteraceae bacterium]
MSTEGDVPRGTGDDGGTAPDELLEQFLIEGRELVQLASDDLLALERTPADRARLDSAFRAVHTLKGSAALVEFAPMAASMHAAEDLLGAVRSQRVTAGPPVFDALLTCIGAADGWINVIGRTGMLPPDAEAEAARLCAVLAAALAAAVTGGTMAVQPPAVSRAAAGDASWVGHLLARAHADAAAAAQAVSAVRYAPTPDCFYLGDDPIRLARAIPKLKFLHIDMIAEPHPKDFDPFACRLLIEGLSGAPPGELQTVFRLVPDQVSIVAIEDATGGTPDQTPGADAAARTLRVDAARVDKLLDIVGELMVATNGLSGLAARTANPQLARDLRARQAEFDRLTGSLHRAVMGMRLLPLDRTFRRLPRLVRSTAMQLGKQVAFEVAGAELEADKSIVDGLFEPLLHVLRNAIDHGIEDAAGRHLAAKPEVGRLALRASRGADHIAIEVADDGAGIDPAAIRAAAQARGMLDAAALNPLDERQLLELIFVPGFSTAAAVSDVSGRGVGMETVRTRIEALGGQVAVASTRGVGTTIRFTLPQSAMVTPVITVRVGREVFGIPMDTVAETARIPACRILPIRGGEAFVLRDRTVPLLGLADLLGMARAPRGGESAYALICDIDGAAVGVEVDAFNERMEVLVRPLSGLLRSLPSVLGTALLADGRLLLVLDIVEVIG